MTKQACPCGSGKSFDRCCGRFLDANESAKTPEQLMRSRYSAYALGGYGEYLLRTWLPVTAPASSEMELSQRSVEWTGLEILFKSQKGDEGTVEFRAEFVNSQAEKEVMHERSVFKRINGCWLYVGGEVG